MDIQEPVLQEKKHIPTGLYVIAFVLLALLACGYIYYSLLTVESQPEVVSDEKPIDTSPTPLEIATEQIKQLELQESAEVEPPDESVSATSDPREQISTVEAVANPNNLTVEEMRAELGHLTEN